jgi:ankyrin repeat protein
LKIRHCGTFFFKGGADVDARNKHSSTPLHDALGGNIDIAQFLVKHGANANLADKWGHSLLYRALQRRKPDVVELLVKGGADVNARERTRRGQ